MRMNLKAKRKELGLTRQQAADKLDITIRAYQYIESGERNPSWKLIHRFEKLFKMPITQLLEISETDLKKTC